MLSFITWEHVATGALLSFGLIVLAVVSLMYVDGYFTFERSEKRRKGEGE